MHHTHLLPALPAQAHLRVLPSALPSVFDYDDYHAFLRDWVAARKEHWPAYSLQLLANRAKIKSRSFLRLVSLGERRMGREVASDVATAMGLDPFERERFLGLVEKRAPQASAPVSSKGRVGMQVGPQRETLPGAIPSSAASPKEIQFACRLPGNLGSDQLEELSRRLRDFQAEMETWISRRNLTSPEAPAGDSISV